ncbi:MAG: Tat pathway signal protein [Pseudomonadota bacterium]
MRLNRRVVALGGVGAAVGLGFAGYAYLDAPYSAAADTLMRPLPADPDRIQLIRYATLAASGHNTQPWRFVDQPGAIEIRPDHTRRTPVVDPDDHHLYASLGCAAENLAIAAQARGYSGAVAALPDPHDGLLVDMTPGPVLEGLLFAAIPFRQCTRSLYDGGVAASEDVDAMVAQAESVGVVAVYLSSAEHKTEIANLVGEGNVLQMADPAFRQELLSWIRFNGRDAVATGDGLYSKALGQPSMPARLGEVAFNMLQNDETDFVGPLLSSAGVFVLAAPTDDPDGWMRVGRAYQRMALTAEALGLKHAFLNQAVEVPQMRAAVQKLSGLDDKRASLVFRIGRAPALPRSLRRPVADVLGTAHQ